MNVSDFGRNCLLRIIQSIQNKDHVCYGFTKLNIALISWLWIWVNCMQNYKCILGPIYTLIDLRTLKYLHNILMRTNDLQNTFASGIICCCKFNLCFTGSVKDKSSTYKKVVLLILYLRFLPANFDQAKSLHQESFFSKNVCLTLH